MLSWISFLVMYEKMWSSCFQLIHCHSRYAAREGGKEGQKEGGKEGREAGGKEGREAGRKE